MSVNLKAERINRGLSVKALAEILGVSRDTIERAERGESLHPSNAFKVADFYGFKVTDVWPLDDAEATVA